MKKAIVFVLQYGIGALIGWYAFAQLAIVIFLMPLYKYPGIFNYETLSPYVVPYDVIGILILIVGVALGLWAVYQKNVFYSVFLPRRSNVTLSLVITLLGAIGFLVFHKDTQAWWRWQVPNNVWKSLLWDVPSVLILSFIYLLPFSALLVYVYQRWHKHQRKGLWKWALISFTINPYFCFLGAAVDEGINFHARYKACGVQASVYKDSPAYKSGMRDREVIQEIDGIKVSMPEDLLEYTSTVTNNEPWHIITNKGEYRISPEYREYAEKYMIGISLYLAYCNSKGDLYQYDK